MTEIYGWCGRILKVDLTVLKTIEINTMDYADRFLGGRGIATRLYWEETSEDISAFDPGNSLIMMTGPLVATGAQGASRFEIVSKSPMTRPEGFCYGNLGGYFGPFMKRAGYDGIVITGKAEKPCYIVIDSGNVEILDASALWGKNVYDVQKWVREKHGQSSHFVTTGIAGENLCRSATVMTDNEGSATGGFGAVMGSKKLKAVVVSGKYRPSIAKPEEFKEINRIVLKANEWKPVEELFPEDQAKYSGISYCYQCGLNCTFRNIYQTGSGNKLVRKCQSMLFYVPWVFSIENPSAENALNATGVCNDYSLCTMEMGNIIQWLDDCIKAGDLTEKDVGLKFSELGTVGFMEKLANMIATREGFGDILAEGLLRAGEKLGRKVADHFTNEVAGVGMGGVYSAREYITNGLLYALEPRQPIAALHEISRLVGYWASNVTFPGSSPVTSDIFRACAEKFWGNDKAWDFTTHEGKAEAAAMILDRTYIKDSLLLCDACWPVMIKGNTPDKIGDSTLENRLFSAVTGIEIDEEGLNLFGERIFNLQRAILLKEGWVPEKDDLPAEFNFEDPVEMVFMNPGVIVPGPGEEVVCLKGKTLDRKAYNEMKNEFYRLRGWDEKTGFQTRETLNRLDLQDIAPELEAAGKLGPK